MKPADSPFRLSTAVTPKSQTLPALTCRWIKKAIQEQRWKEYLPAERRLAADLQVSREVLRHALRELEKEGWIRKASRAKTRILRRTRTKSSPAARKLVALSAHPLFSGVTTLAVAIYRKIFAHVMERGFRVIELHDHRLASHAPRESLDNYRSENPGSVWLLTGACREVQEYCEQNHIPAIVLGHRYPGIRLCAVDMDVKTTCWHATLRLLQKKCRSLHLLFLEQYRAGDIAAREGFEKAIRHHREKNDLAVSTHTVKNTLAIETLIDTAMRGKLLPAGFVSMYPHFAIALVAHCLARGLRVGHDVHIISLYDDAALDMLPAKIPCYSRTALYEKAAELVIRALRGSPLRDRQYLFLPEALD